MRTSPLSNSDLKRVQNRLVERGKQIFDAPAAEVVFTGDPDADRLLNDLRRTPHAFVIGCVMDRQVRAETAWFVPYRLSQRLGGFEFERLASLSRDELVRFMTKPEPLHRFGTVMGENLHAAIAMIREVYNGDAARIWKNKPSSAEVVYRFLQFKGVGPKIATMATNIIARDLKIPFSDYYSIDISADTHVQRVFRRLGLIPEKASLEELIYRARSLSPEFPGLLDLPVWEIGRTWCKPGRPLCQECGMSGLCPTARS